LRMIFLSRERTTPEEDSAAASPPEVAH